MKKIYIIFFSVIFILFFLIKNLVIETSNFHVLKSFINDETKYYIKRYIFPSKLISKLEERVNYLEDINLFLDDKKLSNFDLDFKKSLQNIEASKKESIELSKNLKLHKYKLKEGFVHGIFKKYPGSGFLDFHGEKILILSARGVLGFIDNITNLENKFLIKQINNNINDFIGLNQFSKGNFFSVKDLYIHKNKIFVSYTEEILPNCWNTSIIWAEINYTKIEFKKLFSNKNCINISSPDGEDFSAHQSGGKIINYDESNILLSVGDYRRRFHAQNFESVNGKIIMINTNDQSYKIVSIGHRNPQGMYFDREEKFILISEQGPQGGDEINLIEMQSIKKNKILNFGWPIVSTGEHYGGKREDNKERYKKYPLYKSHKKYGFIEPLKSFVPSIAPTTILKIDDKNYIVASLKDKSLYNFKLDDNNKIIELERIEVFERIRDIIYKKNILYLFLEDTASIGIIDIKNL